MLFFVGYPNEVIGVTTVDVSLQEKYFCEGGRDV